MRPSLGQPAPFLQYVFHRNVVLMNDKSAVNLGLKLHHPKAKVKRA